MTYDDHILHDYLDGDLDEGSCESLQEALRDDFTLRRRLGELERLRSDLAALPRDAVVPERVWEGVAARLDEAPVERDPQVLRLEPLRRPPARGGRRLSFTVPQLAAAALVLVSLGGALTWAVASSGAPMAEAPAVTEGAQPAATTDPVRSPGDVLFAEYQAPTDELMAIVEAGDSLLSEETLTVLRESLTVIDRAVEEALNALDEDPGSEMLLRILQSNMEKKVDLLRHAARAVQEIA